MKQEKRITMMQYYCFHIMTRPGNYLLLARRLLQQFLVDMFVDIKNECLLFIRCQQGRLRADNCQNLRDTVASNMGDLGQTITRFCVASGDRDPRNLGQLVILPSSYVGGPRLCLRAGYNESCPTVWKTRPFRHHNNEPFNGLNSQTTFYQANNSGSA